ncbi:MAG: PhoPQ-activated protein PqaA family protein [bacterium]
MKKSFYSLFCILGLFILSTQSDAAKKNCYSKMSEVLGCFMQHNDGAYRYKFVSENKDNPDITIRTYILYSQSWPVKKYTNIPTTTWRHKLVFYTPKQVSYTKALLYINGGYNKNKNGSDEFFIPKEQIDYANIALNNKAPVIEIEDVPNQFLLFDNTPKKEDQIMAYTYKMVMDDPLQNAYLAGHLPMAKAAVKAMDASQEILEQEYGINITSFILSGASKRGWATWLAALADERVEAIVPIVINVLNTQKSLSYICETYGGVCPPAFMDYEKEGIIQVINTQAATKLMQIEDPFSYMGNDYDSKYKKRLAIPKYIINASGDDFFVPDSSKWYFKKLPGTNNYIRYLPNSMHYFKGNAISDSTNSLRSINEALDSYFYFILNDVSLPKIDWELHDDKIELVSSLKPKEIKIWSSNNEYTRDFRFITSYSSSHLFSKKILSYFSRNIGDNQYEEETVDFTCEEKGSCKVGISLPKFKKGWQASFAEVHYDINDVHFVVTTEVDIAPKTMPVALNNKL